MNVAGKVCVVTGGASGIGAGLARRFAAEGAAGVLVADLDEAGATRLAVELADAGTRAIATGTDVGVRSEVDAMIDAAEQAFGPVDLLCSNAGIAPRGGGDADWAAAWAVNVMAHVYAAERVLPGMLERGSGTLLHTCSAAGLMTQPGDPVYTATKHAAVGYAEWLAITYGAQGIHVAALCPQGVRTPLLEAGLEAADPAARAVLAAGTMLEVEQVADSVIEALADERFLVLPHPEVHDFMQYKAADRDGWITAVRRLLGD